MGKVLRSIENKALAFGLFCSFSLLWSLPAAAQFTTATMDGVISANEYGVHTNGQNQQNNGGTTYYMCWDANNLYLAFSGSNFNEAAVLYLDYNPVIPVNGGTNASGSNQGLYTYDRNHMMLPFRADFVLYFKNGYNEYRRADGAGYWGGNTAFSLATGNNGGTNTCEITVPWNTITGGAGRPAEFNWLTFKTYDYGPGTNGIYSALPQGNPNCACNQDPSRLYPTRYYNVLNTTNGSSTKPFSTVSFTYYEDYSVAGTGGYYQNGGTFYDFTINDNSANNNDNAPGFHLYDNNEISNRVLIDGNISITHNLYVGQGSALLPANNTPTAVNANLTFTGASGSIYNYGRIDANPEAANAGDWNNRRINVTFAGTTRLMQTNLFKEMWRLSNVTVNPGAVLNGPTADSTSIEVQWGTWNNQGTVNFGDGSAGFVDLGTRGDWSQHNDYFLTGTGTWLMHQVLIGRNSSRLQPLPGGTAVRLQVQGDFENYDEFQGRVGAARIDVVMAGTRRQYLKGNTTETTGAQTSFYNLEINNSNALSNNNNTADVFIQSFGGGTIDYYVTGQLRLVNGDITTRDRVSNIVHNLTLRDSATVDFAGAKSNIGLNGSCFVDGPLRWEVENAGWVTRQFPLGKTKTVLGYQLGDYRHLQLEIDLNTAAKTVFSGEMFLDDRSLTYTWPVPVPEVIAWISRQRYWNLSKVSGANVDGAFVTLAYDQIERTDGVINAAALRIVKDNGIGDWVNITPLGPGGTANQTGTIRSHVFTGFSDFTLASVDNGQLLPLDLLTFDARKDGDKVLLDWETMREVNTAAFVVESSRDRVHFLEVGQVQAAGNSELPLRYSFEDGRPDWTAQVLHYRLKMVDLDGGIAYSPVRTVVMDAGMVPQVHCYPNPAHGQVRIEVLGGENTGSTRLSLANSLGQIVWEQALEAGPQVLDLDWGHLAAGIYHLTLHSARGNFVERISLQ